MTLRDLKYADILKQNKALAGFLPDRPFTIAVLANITVHQLKEIMEYALRTDGVPASVVCGDYNTIIQDSVRLGESNVVILFWELCNLIEGLHYQVEKFDDQQYRVFLEKTKTEIDLVLKNLRHVSLVLFNTFSALPFSYQSIKSGNFEKLANDLNGYLYERLPANVKYIDLDKVIAGVGVSESIDWRYFYASKALYTVEFYKAYADYVKPHILTTAGRAKKALIFDGDNTLWKGIVGEDGFDRIEMSQDTPAGAIFAEVQSIALTLHNQGVLLGLCSKNNPEDIEQVIASHPNMQIRPEHLTINKSNWNDKATNLQEIARALNIGIDSMVYVDDSAFEVHLIRERLPEVTVLQVPERLHEYPAMLRRYSGLFYTPSVTAEDLKKTEMYKQQAQREQIKQEFKDIEDYLASLALKVVVYEDEASLIPRMAQMSQKTNQFNLTTRRYTEADIEMFVKDPHTKVFAFSVSDKFGDSGVTGLCMLKTDFHNASVDIDTLLMSCRIIGRNIEYAFMDFLIQMLKEQGILNVRARYIKTAKNSQVEKFYESCSFSVEQADSDTKSYTLRIPAYIPKRLAYIEIRHG